MIRASIQLENVYTHILRLFYLFSLWRLPVVCVDGFKEGHLNKYEFLLSHPPCPTQGLGPQV